MELKKLGKMKSKVWNDFKFTGHPVSSDSITNLGYTIPQSQLQHKVNISNGMF